MNKTRNSVLLGLACICILIWGIILGYTLAPPKPVRELVYVSEQVHLSYIVDRGVTITLAFTVQHTMTFEITINTTTTNTLEVQDSLNGLYIYTDLTNFTMMLEPTESLYYFFDHTFVTVDFPCLVEYFLY